MSISQLWVVFATILGKEVKRFVRIWVQTILSPVITQSLYFLIFGSFIGGRITNFVENGKVLTYMEFILPGLVMMSIITSAFNNVVSSFFGAKFQKSIEELIVSPVPNWLIIAGYSIGGVLRGILVGLIVFSVSVFFITPQIQSLFWVLVFAILSSIIFSLAGFLNGIFAKKFDDIGIFQIFVITPLVYLGGVFYLIRNLPENLQFISKFNPILYMINGFRYGFYGEEFVDINITFSWIFLVFVSIALYLINLILLRKGVGIRK